MNPPSGEVKAVGRGRGPWRSDQPVPVVELRRPQNVSALSDQLSSTSITSSKGEIAEATPAPVQSKLSANAKEFVPLSVNAKEFVPRGFTCAPTASDPEPSTSSQYYYEDDGYYFDNADVSSDISLEWVLQYMTEVLTTLTRNPGKFDHLAKSLVDEIVPMLNKEDATESIVALIVEEAITEQNFRYSGARLCNLLNNYKLPEQGSVFRNVLLTKLYEEHQGIEENLTKDPKRVYGFLHFLGELYIQLEIRKGCGERISVLGDGLIMALKLLIEAPLVDNIKHTCDVLKLTGNMLTADKSEAMDDFFISLENLLVDERCGKRPREMIKSILNLRQSNWGHGANTGNPVSPITSVIPSPLSPWETYYGPDHKAITAEEYNFLNESCGKDETESTSSNADDATIWDPHADEIENAEIMAAFREFAQKKP